VDLELPTESGYDLCEYIRGQLGFARVPILVTGESGFPEDLVCAEAAGATAFLRKPFSMREFSSSIEAVLDGVPQSGTEARSIEP
jgi:DNA-binding response OmpR family regulator